jgi:hypothetical protein
MTSNSRRSSWTTRRCRDRPLRSTPCPQEEGAPCSSSCFYAHHSRNRRILRWSLPLLSPTRTTMAKARVRGRGKARTTTLVALATIVGAPRCGPPSTIPRPVPSRCGQGCVLHSNSRRIHRSMPGFLHWGTMVLPMAPPSRPCRRLHRTSGRPRPLPGHPGWALGINSH